MKAILPLMLLCLTGTTPSAIAQTPGEIGIGGTLSEATLQGLSGGARKLSTYRGKPLIINVWASWCGPCRQEMQSLQRLANRPGATRYTVIGISTDDDPEAAKAYLKSARITFSQFIDAKLKMENMLGANKIPLTLLIDAKGRIVEKYYGAEQWDGPSALEAISMAFHMPM